MEENERGRGRGLPIDALEGRLEALGRRNVLLLAPADRGRVLGLVSDLVANGTSGDDLVATLVGWFTRREATIGFGSSDAVRRAEAFVEYLLDVSAEGETRAFQRLSATLSATGGDRPGHAA